MTWTTDEPAASGWYWLRYRYTVGGPEVVRVEVGESRELGTKVYHTLSDDFGNLSYEAATTYAGAKWCGPLVPPGEG